MGNNYQSFKKKLFDRKSDKSLLFFVLKSRYSFEEQIKTIKQIPSAFNTLLYGRSLFKSEEDFGKEELQFQESAQIQLGWYAHLFKRYAKEINLFLEQKKIFETALLNGNYSLARNALVQIQNSVSHSYWGLENMFLLTQYEKGLEYNFKVLDRIYLLGLY